MEEKMRADAALYARGLAASREKARGLIAAGLANVNGAPISKPAQKVAPSDALEVLGQAHPYVGRGGLKLEKALKVFDVDPAGAVCADVGASTGGFTDVLLQNGAKRVYAIDVGFGQLDPLLAADPRVVSMERTNARALTPDMFPARSTLAVMDVSFISVTLVMPALFEVLGDGGRLICLIKPQFEAGRAQVGKHGVVSKPSAHAEALRKVCDFAMTLGWQAQGLDYSPIAGGSGNLEFLGDFVPRARCARWVSPEDIAALVKRAHAAVPLK